MGQSSKRMEKRRPPTSMGTRGVLRRIPASKQWWLLNRPSLTGNRGTRCDHPAVNHPMERRIYSLHPSQGKRYLGSWKSSAGAGLESSAPIFAVSWFLAPCFTSRSLVEILARLFDREEPCTSLPARELLILSFLTGEGKDEPE